MEYIEDVDAEVVTSRSLFNTQKKLVFEPLVYEQRYIKTSHILNLPIFRSQIKNILEFGCAEMKFFTYLKNGLKHARQIDMVDIDGELLEKCKIRIVPLINEHINRREVKLIANVWKGDVAVPNQNFKDIDAVVAIEL